MTEEVEPQPGQHATKANGRESLKEILYPSIPWLLRLCSANGTGSRL